MSTNLATMLTGETNSGLGSPLSRTSAYMSALYHDLLAEYRRRNAPIDVSFRQLVGPVPVNDHSHSISPYPGRLLRQIPRFFFHCDQIARPGDVVLDPFCGSGTVLVEARVAKLTNWGIDQNPYARLLSSVKTTPLDQCVMVDAARLVLSRAKAARGSAIPDVVNIRLWYAAPVIARLGRLRRAIDEGDFEKEVRDYLLVSLALTADRCSFRDPRIPVPVRKRNWQDQRESMRCSLVWETFRSVTSSVAEKVGNIPSPPGVTTIVRGCDAGRALEIFQDDLPHGTKRPSLILTSPPYGAAQKYIRSSSLALGWAGLASPDALADLERGCIGREHLREKERNLQVPSESLAAEINSIAAQDSLRAAIYAEYFRRMHRVLENLAELLAPGGFLVLIAGSNTVTGRSISTHAYLRDLAMELGLTPELELRDTIRGRVLLTKRASKTQPLHYETVHVLRKGNG